MIAKWISDSHYATLIIKIICNEPKPCVCAGVEALIVEALPAVNDELTLPAVNDEFTPIAVFTPPAVNDELTLPAVNEEFTLMVLLEPAEVMLTP